jgi:hypothetical protein
MNQKKRILIIFFNILLILPQFLYAQEEETGILEAILPERDTRVINLEGEDALGTNFARIPTLSYEASGQRTLQLNRYGALADGKPFFTEYVFYVDQSESFQFWYAGTPPGPEEDLFPSYFSPFSFGLDDGPLTKIYRKM